MDLTNYIFYHDDYHSYYKITGNWYGTDQRRGYYPCIKCTKHGKEFTATTSWSCSLIDRLFAEGKMVRCGLTEDVKVSTAGAASGARKRRIQWIEAEMRTLTAELERLKEEELS